MVRRFRRLLWISAAPALLLWLAAGVSIAEQAAKGARVTNPFEGRADLVQDGRSLFNQYCAHCHGPNAQQGERPRDLRRLKLRYGNDAAEMFYTTINDGRLDLGMPVWKGVLSEEIMWRIFTYLQTVQTEP